MSGPSTCAAWSGDPLRGPPTATQFHQTLLSELLQHLTDQFTADPRALQLDCAHGEGRQLAKAGLAHQLAFLSPWHRCAEGISLISKRVDALLKLPIAPQQHTPEVAAPGQRVVLLLMPPQG